MMREVMFQHHLWKGWIQSKSSSTEAKVFLTEFLQALNFRGMNSFSTVIFLKGLCWLSHMGHNSISSEALELYGNMQPLMQRTGSNTSMAPGGVNLMAHCTL
jgi:hypothetical protein